MMLSSRPSLRPSAPRALRALGLAAALALLAGCGGDPAAGPAVGPAAGPAAAPGAAPAAASPAFDREFTVDAPNVGSEVGERVAGAGLRSTGRAGWLVFGPYIALPRGHYVVELRGVVEAGHAGELHVVVADAKGANVIAAVDVAQDAIGDPAGAGVLATLAFQLAADSDDFEVRVRVTEASRVSVSGYRIRSTP
jgi:hypothetical protein